MSSKYVYNRYRAPAFVFDLDKYRTKIQIIAFFLNFKPK